MGQVLEERHWKTRAADQLALEKGSSGAVTAVPHAPAAPSAAAAAKDSPVLFHRQRRQREILQRLLP